MELIVKTEIQDFGDSMKVAKSPDETEATELSTSLEDQAEVEDTVASHTAILALSTHIIRNDR